MRDSDNVLEHVRVLVVDDDAAEAAMLSVALGLYGADVGVAASVGEARGLVSEWRPDVLLSNITLMDGDGMDLLRAVRQTESPDRTHLPSVALTGLMHDGDRAAATDAGFDLYLARPVALERLVDALAHLAVRQTGTAPR